MADTETPLPPTPNTCPQAWHGGLPFGLLHECVRKPKHTGWHQNADGSLKWGGKLTEEEHALANALREALKEGAPS